MGLLKSFFSKKNNEKESFEQNLQQTINYGLDKTTKVQEKNVEVQMLNSEIHMSSLKVFTENSEMNKEFKNLIVKNQENHELLIKKEEELNKDWIKLDDQRKELRVDEINITAKKAEARGVAEKVRRELKLLEQEKELIAKREKDAEFLKMRSDKKEAKYNAMSDELNKDKSEIEKLKADTKDKNQRSKENKKKSDQIMKKAETFEEDMKTTEEAFEIKRKEIEESLHEKSSEYDRKLAELELAKQATNDLIFDDTYEGYDAKIVVKESIRIAKRELEDLGKIFGELDEKYASGTFKGFATPISAIDIEFLELKSQYSDIREHYESNEELPILIEAWIDSVEVNILEADKFIKSWEFSEAYRHILTGLATCKNYEKLLEILVEYGGDEYDEENNENEEVFKDWYEILDVEEKATISEIKTAFHQKAKDTHPDKNKGMEEIFKEIKEAYEILSNESKRELFNEVLRKRRG